MTSVVPRGESIMKMLLTSGTHHAVQNSATTTGGSTSLIATSVSNEHIATSVLKQEPDDGVVRFSNFYTQLAGSADREVCPILLDHCYARPWNWRPETSFLKPTKTLFVPKTTVVKRKSNNPLAPLQNCDDIIDVESEPLEPPPIYDLGKAKHLMEECDRHAGFARTSQDDEDWEDSVSRVNWTPAQNRLFNGMVNILSSDHMARLACSGLYNEPILRRTVIDKSVKRIRQLMATISWDPKLTQWLHQLLIDHLSVNCLSAYLDILQTLKSKLPTFIDKMMYGPSSSNRVGVLSNESLFPLLRRPWDPVASSLLQDKPKKLPGNPVIIIAPSAPTASNSYQLRRQHKWISLLSNLASVTSVQISVGTTHSRATLINNVDQMLASTRAKILETRADFPGRAIVLVGFNSGAALALQVAQLEPVLCVVCFGFSVLTAEGKRGEPDDSLLELQCPVLFVIGQCSHTSLQEDMEDLRERMRVETGLIVVGSADDHLRVSKKKKRAEGITQSVVDRCIVDEVGEFVSGIMLSPYPPQMRQSPAHVSTDAGNNKRTKVERRRNNSNGSSVDSEPPSPTPRITRPVGRPPGKSKSKLEAKWAAQVAQGTPSNISPSSSPPPVASSFTPSSQSKIDSSKNESKSASTNIVYSVEKASKPTLSNPMPSKFPTGSTLTTLLQGGCRPTVTPSKTPASGIRVLENLTLNTNSTAKLISSTGRTIDFSKITVLNSVTTSKAGGSIGNVILLPDGKLKAIGSTVKGIGSSPLILPMSTKSKPNTSTSISPTTTSPKSRVKYITSKKQLMTSRPPKAVKKPFIATSSLLSPANLTSQDIMDLPIIFADDNRILTDNTLQQDDAAVQDIVQTNQASKFSLSNSGNKLLLVNKTVPSTQTNVISPSNLKRPLPLIPVRSANNPIKYAKIILSKRSPTDEVKLSNSNIITKISNLSPEISIKKVDRIQPLPNEPFDLENELEATAVPKRNFKNSELKSITLTLTKKNQDITSSIEDLEKTAQALLKAELAKTTEEVLKESEEDPDYIPFKKPKIEEGI